MIEFRYKSYTHEIAEASVVIQRTPLFTEAHQVYGYRETWTISGSTEEADGEEVSVAV